MEIQTHIQHHILAFLVISVIFPQLAIDTLCATLCLAPVKLSKHRSSHRRCSVRKSVIRNFEKFTGKHLCQGLFFNKVPGSGQRLWRRCFPVNFAKLLRTPFLTEHLRWLLLNNYSFSILTFSIFLTLIYLDQIIKVHG